MSSQFESPELDPLRSSRPLPTPRQVLDQMTQGFGPATHMVVAGQGSLEDSLVESKDSLTVPVGEAHRYYHLMA